jgi:fluoride exporter
MLATGATLGSFARFGLVEWTSLFLGRAFPYGTLLVNVLGSFVLGLFLTLATGRLAVSPNTRILVATGFCGSFTTFSTFSYQVVHLLQEGNYVAGVVYPLISLVGGVLAVLLGIALGTSFSSRR